MENTSAVRTRGRGGMWLFAILFVAVAGAAAADSGETHAWKDIYYPRVSVPGMPGMLSVLVDSGMQVPAPHLRISLHWGTGPGEALKGLPAALPDAKKIVARLHLADGRIVSPGPGGFRDWIGIGSGLGTDWTVMYSFPWADNKLEEAWIELRLPQQTFWVELPYGFARNPSDPLLPDPDHGSPVFPPAMKDLPAKDVLVPWLSVEYDLGWIQNHWNLRLRVSNPFTARAEAILYRENGQWDLHTPRTALETQWPGGRSEAHCVGIRRSDVFRRNDDYLLGGGPDPDKGRLWGKVVIKVDDQSYECVVPSSLFKYTHGITDPYHKQRLPRPKPPDGDF